MMRASRVALLAGLASSAAHAAVVNATFTGVAPGQDVGITGPNGALTTRAGVYQFHRNLDNPGDQPGLTPDFPSFCIEVTEPIAGGQSVSFDLGLLRDAPTSVPGGMGLARETRIAELVARHYGDAFASDSNAAAFQLAVWELVSDDAPDLATGVFQVNSAPEDTINTAALWLGQINGEFTASVFALTSIGAQDYLVAGNLIPAPGTLGLLAIGGLAAARRRRA